MPGDLFDSPWKILIIAVVVIVLFGSRKLPDAARSLGRSMRILKAEIKDMHDDDADGGAQAQQVQPQPQQLAPNSTIGAPVAPPASVPVPEAQQDTRPA
jgi:sec-independent protein translocase protein TatA